MTAAKILACYPCPTDVAAFEKAYAEEHLPMAGPLLAAAGATRIVLTKLEEPPGGKPHFYRIAEIQFASMEKLGAALASNEVQRVAADANRISSGGPVVMMVSGPDTAVDF